MRIFMKYVKNDLFIELTSIYLFASWYPQALALEYAFNCGLMFQKQKGSFKDGFASFPILWKRFKIRIQPLQKTKNECNMYAASMKADLKCHF